jgi:hypothetical protein
VPIPQGLEHYLTERRNEIDRKYHYRSAVPQAAYSHDYATVIVDQIVVVVSQSGRRPTLGGVGRIGIRGRYVILLMHRLFGGILLLQFHQVLAYGFVHLRRFR